jgi:hypothetical protein
MRMAYEITNLIRNYEWVLNKKIRTFATNS